MGQLRISSPGGVRRSPPESAGIRGVCQTPPDSTRTESGGVHRTQSSGVHWSPVLQWTSPDSVQWSPLESSAPVDFTGLQWTPPDSAGLQQALTGEVIRDYLIKKY